MYILITFVNRGTQSTPIWEVYGVVSEHENKNLGTYKTKYGAMMKAHSYVLPVMQGFTNSYHVAKTIQTLKGAGTNPDPTSSGCTDGHKHASKHK
jgi:hypothetical protein